MLHRFGKRLHAPLLRSARTMATQAVAVTTGTPKPTAADRRRAGQIEITSPSPANSIVDSIFPSKMPRVPLDQPFPSGFDVKPRADAVSDELKVTTLPNGLRVASKNSNSPIAHVGVFVEIGSRYESVQYNGITRFLEQMAFKSTKNRSAFRLVRDMGKLAANLSASAGREHLIFTGDILRHNVPYILGTLQDVMFHHAYSIDELNLVRNHAIEEADAREKNPEQTMLEAVHEAAYLSNTVGLSLFPRKGSLERLTPDVLTQWARNAFVPSRVVISAVGVDHEEFAASVDKIFKFPAENQGKGIPKTPAKYNGGDLRMHRTIGEGEKNLAHVAIAFETASWNSPDLVPMCVLQMMMGGGSGFSTGGPGKGMYSRCYTNILNRYDWVDTASCFNSIFTDTGLFGFYGSAAPESLGQLAEVLINECNGMTGNVDPQELSRAKNQLKSSVYMQLESASLQLEDIGRQIATYGKFTTAAELGRQVDAVTAADIKRVASRMLKSAPSIAAYGDLTFLPRYEAFPKAIKS